MNQRYWDELRHSFKNDFKIDDGTGYELTEWSSRVYRCAKRVVSAVSFRETSRSAFEATESPLLPSIGYYYAMFHMGVAILYLDYATKRLELYRITHECLQDLVKSRLVQRSVIPRQFIELLNKTKQIREFSNYVLCGYLDFSAEDTYFGKFDLDIIHKEIGDSFESGFNFIKQASDEIGSTNHTSPNLNQRISTVISDTLLGNLAALHLSKMDEERVSRYLLSVGLSIR